LRSKTAVLISNDPACCLRNWTNIDRLATLQADAGRLVKIRKNGFVNNCDD